MSMAHCMHLAASAATNELQQAARAAGQVLQVWGEQSRATVGAAVGAAVGAGVGQASAGIELGRVQQLLMDTLRSVLEPASQPLKTTVPCEL